MYTQKMGNGTKDGFAQFVDWCHALFARQCGVAGSGESKDRYNLKLNDGTDLAFVWDSANSCCIVESKEPFAESQLQILRDASDRAARGEFGLTQWWEFELATRHGLDAAFGVNMMRMLGQTRAFKGKWRLGDAVIAEFTVEGDEKLAAFAKQEIKVAFRCSGPGHGPRAQKIARKQADVIRAVLAFCTATTLEGGVFIKPADESVFPPGTEVNRALPELVVRGVPVWSRLSEAAEAGAPELAMRMVNALTSFEHALHQPTDEAATLFYVASIEALTVPKHRYAHFRVTGRFRECLLRLAQGKLVETLGHANFSESFESNDKRIKNASQLADRIYALRSSPVHSGQFGLERNLFAGMSSMGGPIRTALIAEVAEAAILEFFGCPFSSLVGHMEFDPVCRVELTSEEYAVVREAAYTRGMSLEDYILQALGLPLRSAY